MKKEIATIRNQKSMNSVLPCVIVIFNCFIMIYDLKRMFNQIVQNMSVNCLAR